VANRFNLLLRLHRTFRVLPSNIWCTFVSMILGFLLNVPRNSRRFEFMVSSNVPVEL
jgi:hypothetical protein